LQLTVTERPEALSGRQQSLSDLVHEQMLTLITDGTWPARSRLPSEVELVARFGVSRPIVRQALARLRDGGFVASRQGSGSFVQALEPVKADVHFPAINSVADLERCLHFREGVEGEAAAAAATYHTEPRVAQLREAAARSSAGELGLGSAELDFAFHLAVAEASENPFYVNTLSSLKGQVVFGMNLARSFSMQNGPAAVAVAEQHGAIVEAIVARDPERARDAMRKHLGWARQRLLTGVGSGQ
jgi:DNA-binding FadR family transcriptional regulator